MPACDDASSARPQAHQRRPPCETGAPNIALQLTGTALHLSLVKSLARLHQRSKAAPAAERNVGRRNNQSVRSAPNHHRVDKHRSCAYARLGARATNQGIRPPPSLRIAYAGDML